MAPKKGSPGRIIMNRGGESVEDKTESCTFPKCGLSSKRMVDGGLSQERRECIKWGAEKTEEG